MFLYIHVYFYMKNFLSEQITDLSKSYFIKKSSTVVLHDGSYVNAAILRISFDVTSSSTKAFAAIMNLWRIFAKQEESCMRSATSNQAA